MAQACCVESLSPVVENMWTRIWSGIGFEHDAGTQRVLQAEGSGAASLWESSSDFERWIKVGPEGHGNDAVDNIPIPVSSG
jgi:hypothetical protein